MMYIYNIYIASSWKKEKEILSRDLLKKRKVLFSCAHGRGKDLRFNLLHVDRIVL